MGNKKFNLDPRQFKPSQRVVTARASDLVVESSQPRGKAATALVRVDRGKDEARGKCLFCKRPTDDTMVVGSVSVYVCRPCGDPIWHAANLVTWFSRKLR